MHFKKESVFCMLLLSEKQLASKGKIPLNEARALQTRASPQTRSWLQNQFDAFGKWCKKYKKIFLWTTRKVLFALLSFTGSKFRLVLFLSAPCSSPSHEYTQSGGFKAGSTDLTLFSLKALAKLPVASTSKRIRPTVRALKNSPKAINLSLIHKKST